MKAPMKNPFKRDTESALTAAQEDVAATEAKIADLQSERQSILLGEDIGTIAALDQKISDQHRALKVHQDRVSALQAQQRREHHEQLKRERDAAVATLEEAFSKSNAKAIGLEAAVKVLGDTLFELLFAREAAFAAWPENLPRPSYQVLRSSNLLKELGWALFAAGRPTAMEPCRIPAPNNIGLGIAGIEPKGIAGCIETEQSAIVDLLKGAPIEQEEAAW